MYKIPVLLMKHVDDFNLSIILLRYFNPVWSHSSFLVGDDPKSPENLMPKLCLSVKKSKSFYVFGNSFKNN